MLAGGSRGSEVQDWVWAAAASPVGAWPGGGRFSGRGWGGGRVSDGCEVVAAVPEIGRAHV